MSEYRVFTLDRQGRIGLPESIRANGDSEALAKARSITPDAKLCELWQGRRLVATLEGNDLSS